MRKALLSLSVAFTAAVCIIGLAACGVGGHKHSMTYHAAVAATCTGEGGAEYWSCSECGKNFADAEGNEEIENIVIPALGHDWGAWTVTEAATCEREGERLRVCSACGAEDKENTARIAHDLNEHVAAPATCTSAGNLAYWECNACGGYFADKEGQEEIKDKQSVILPASHSFKNDWSYDDEGHWHGCLHCDERSGYATHDLTGGKCSVCGFEKGTEGLEYKLVDMGAAYEVTGMGTAAAANVVIPSVYNGKPVVGLGTGAFANEEGLESVSLPSSVTYMEEGVFRSSSLTSIYIADINAWCGIFHRAAWANDIVYDLYLNGEAVIDLVLPKSVTEIESYAFFNCGSLANVTLGKQVESIGSDAFTNTLGHSGLTAYCYAASRPEGWSDEWTNGAEVWDCANNDQTGDGYRFVTVDGVKYLLNSGRAFVRRQSTALSGIVSVKGSVEYGGETYPVYSIGGGAFSYCRHITELNVGGIELIDGTGAFLGCTSLERVNLPEGIIEIPSETFALCSSLKSIYIPQSVVEIGRDAFTGCASLSSATFGGDGTWYVRAQGSSTEKRVSTFSPNSNAIMLRSQYCKYYWRCK